MTLDLEGARIVIDGIGFAAIGRLTLLTLLADRARGAGVDLVHDHALGDPDALDADLVIAADGANSLIRNGDPTAFDMTLEHFSNRFCWFGTTRPFDTLTQTFVRTERGALNAHHYRYQPDMSTFIVECDAASFEAHGFSGMDETETALACADIFRDTLEGAPLVANRSIWRRFPRLWCDNWVSGNRVVIGDAAHTAHFSVGSGTRLAMEDAIALSRALAEHADLDTALAAFQAARKPIAKKIVDAANISALWYENFADTMRLAPLDFGFDYITRSGRIDMARLRQMSPDFMAEYEAHRMRSAS
jgi:2-polyprenyl-6-methoxyphenol hydroxylase-like FAD-dependent oxidoreductase